MSAKLKFPQVRLMIYDVLVTQHVGCVQAIVRCAHQLGLIRENRLTDLKLPIETPECGSLFAAEHVLKQCLSEQGFCLNNGDKEMADKLWATVQGIVAQYKADSGMVHERKPGTVSPITECSDMAAVVMDALLQVLQPYV